MKMSDETVIAAIDEQISCDLSDGSVVLNLHNGVYYGLNPVGCRIWQLVQKPIQFREIRETLLQEYEVDTERCTAEIMKFLREMAERDLISIGDKVGFNE